MIREHYLQDATRLLRKYKDLADRAIEQVTDEQLFQTLDAETNSIAIVMKHLAGNMRSRWTDFLTTDGEKPDRHRDREFETEDCDSAGGVRERWEAGWDLTFRAVARLHWQDLEKTVTIRGEPHTVVEAIGRQLTHYAYHVGQIVLLARHFAGADWQTLSIPRGESATFEVARDGTLYKAGDNDRSAT